MKHLPKILKVRRNSGPTVSGAFIDAGWVWHYIAQGRWQFHMAGRSWSVNAGDSVLIPPRLLHVVRPLSQGVHEVIIFNLLETYTLDASSYVLPLPVAERHRVSRWFSEILETAEGPRAAPRPAPDRDLEASGLLAAILGVHLRCGKRARESSPTSGPGWPEVEAAVLCIQDRYQQEGLSLGAIGKAAGVTPQYLCRIFMRNMGCSVMDHLSEHRLQRAEELLLTTTLNCSQIAEATGFSGLHVFSRVFRRRRMLSPTEFRLRHAPRLT